MSQVLYELPPNYKQITAAIPAVAKNKAIVFVYAPYIYSPAGIELRPDLKAHEEVHVTRQGDDPQAWWDKYLVDTDFRLQEELVAYQVQYKYMEVHYDRANLAHFSVVPLLCCGAFAFCRAHPFDATLR